jgi:FlaG/FlaF family flagellin (archaellin)
MSGERIKRKVVWENSGVSEIIGTILMLSITVVLFSGVITMVGTLPAPKQNFVVDLKCSLHPVDQSDWSAGVYFRVLHQGGQVMDDLWITIYLAVDDTMLVNRVNDGLRDFNGDGKWNVGEYWEIFIGSADVNSLDNDSKFSVTIIDQERNTLVWSEILGLATHSYSPIIKRAWVDTDIATPVDDTGPISFTAPFIMYVEILDPQNNLNKSSISVNMETMYKDGRPPTQLLDTFIDTKGVEYGHLDDNIYLAVCPQPNRTYVGYYIFEFTASNYLGNSSKAYFRFPVGLIVGDNPQIVVESENIRFSKNQPTNGDEITITATIQNLGGAGSRVNVSFYMNDKTKIIGNTTILVPQSGERDAIMKWLASPGGNHTIIASAWPLDGVEDPSATWDNEANRSILVMPRILLVDDDGHINDLSDRDTVSFMRASLEAADFNYDFVVVGSGDGPGYDYGDYPLKDYDIVIWMTGFREVNTLTVKDTEQLRLYLNGGTMSPVGGLVGGSLWLVSQGFWKEARMPTAPAQFVSFAVDYLKTPTPFLMDDIDPFPTQLRGNETNPVTDYFADNFIPTYGGNNVLYWPNLSPDGNRVALTNTGESKVFAWTYDSDMDNGNPTNDSRRLSQSWGFSRISDTAAQAQYAYKAIMWLGKIEYKFTEDVAISSQTTRPDVVFFKQPVTISFTVRNNGFKVYDPAVDRVEYLLRIYDVNNNVIKESYSYLNQTLGIGNDNTATVNESWTPQTLGYHRIWIMVDPFNLIPENNKLNNMISNYWGAGELNVRYRVLVVDDDEDTGGPGNETASFIASLDYLDYDYELYNVSTHIDDGPPFEAGMNGASLSEYNAVIWISGDVVNPLRTNDVANITSYMELGGNFWFLGTGMWNDNAMTDFQKYYLKVASVNANQGTGNDILGILNDPISHGIDFSITDDPNADYIMPDTAAGATGFTHDAGVYNSVRFQGPNANNIIYRAVTTAWRPSKLDDFQQRTEFIFMVLRWFDKPEERIEARITDVDILILDGTGGLAARPQIGSGYVIRATAHNTGGATANVLVRFMDGSTQIGSSSISILPRGKTTTEMIWVPLFAGQRSLSVLVDPISEVSEIFDWSNNNATISKYVYFFWDDMESGAAKWSHSSTILHISGEGALEYFHDTALRTNIISEWNSTQSVGLTQTLDPGFYHSYRSAYWLQETPGGGNGTGGTRGAAQPVPMATPVEETRYMRGDQSNVNNLLGFNLGLTQSNLPQESASVGKNSNIYVGIRVWIRNGTTDAMFELTPGSARAVNGRTAAFNGYVTGSWTPAARAMNATDSIVVRVYIGTTATPGTLVATFTTPRLGVSQLDANPWTVYYYLVRGGPGTDSQFYWGSNTYNSRIEGFTHTTLDMTPPTVQSTIPLIGASNVPTSQNVYVTFSELMNTDATNRPTLTQILGTDTGGWSFSTWLDDYTAVWTHTNWLPGDLIRLRLSGAQDRSSNVMAPYEWWFTTTTGPTATATGPVGISNVATITLTYSWVGNPTHVALYYSNEYNETLGHINWTHIGNDAPPDGSHVMTLTEAGEYWWIAVAVGGGSMQMPPVNGSFPDTISPYIYDNVRPTVTAAYPQNLNVPVDAYIVIMFTKFINPTTVAITISPNPGGQMFYWNAENTVLTIAHFNFMPETVHTITITSARDMANNILDPIPYSWMFVTGESSAGELVDWFGKTPAGTNSNKTAVTETMDLTGVASARLSFWHKYNLLPGVNGGFLQVGYKDAGEWKWKYVIPTNAYTGNLREPITDSLGNPVKWCWNGISARGTFGWDYVELNILANVDETYRGEVRLKFNYTQWGNGTGYGWYVDDVRVTVSRSNSDLPAGSDLWEMVTTSDRFGSSTTAWYNRDPANPANMAAGIDNSITTQPIDLTNARNAHLSAYVKFNFNENSGGPPDGFRIEVTKDNGITWEPINLGVRSSWGVSGTEYNASGKSYTGVMDSGTVGYWVNVGTLTRVTTDLSSFSGNVIQIRIRLVTNADPLYLHNNNHNVPNPGFGGFYVDDVQVIGETILS